MHVTLAVPVSEIVAVRIPSGKDSTLLLRRGHLCFSIPRVATAWRLHDVTPRGITPERIHGDVVHYSFFFFCLLKPASLNNSPTITLKWKLGIFDIFQNFLVNLGKPKLEPQ